jgi:hypothetical protein
MINQGKSKIREEINNRLKMLIIEILVVKEKNNKITKTKEFL